MRISENPPLHLTYCLNVHPGESWEEIFDAIGAHARRVRDNVGREQAYGLGLRLGNAAARSLAEPGALETFRAYLRDENLYVFTINGFPYGRFHGRAVKENVYRPDWRTDDRRRYTIQLAELLAGLLPEDCPGTISTVPCSFKPWIVSDQDRLDMIRNLVACVRHLRWLSIEHGKEISLGLEPEPCCYLETTAGFLEFYEEELLRHGAPLLATALQIGRGEAEEAIRRHLGLCLDTCHLVAAGYDIISETGYEQGFTEFDEILGLNRLAVFHLNDSKKPLGSRVDRHDGIGQGHLGTEPFRRLVQDSRFTHLPMMLEPPKKGGGKPSDVTADPLDIGNLSLLKGFRDGS